MPLALAGCGASLPEVPGDQRFPDQDVRVANFGWVSSSPHLSWRRLVERAGGEFVLIDEEGKVGDRGEMFLVPPIPGLSTELLNRDHHEVYFKDAPVYQGIGLRRHGDELLRMENGYYRAQGRSDDSMNLGGIKVSSVQIEEIINQLDFVKESAAIAVSPVEGGPSQLVVYAVCLPTDESVETKLSMARQIIRNKLNPLFKVQELIELEALPRTASGKVMRRNLRTRYQEKNSES